MHEKLDLTRMRLVRSYQEILEDKIARLLNQIASDL